ncbi:hypothetical protein FJR11_04375 [Anabaena sp. UHCC 0187]|nr:hypothetical protein [Anabaena sp. UHCC 0187]
MEWSEFETVYRKKDIAQLKAFMARKRDTYRAPYDIQNNDHLRRFVFCGTSNESEILNDPTGSRRFWIIPLKNKIPLELVSQLRDRIWAAANALFKTGYQFFLSDEEEIQREALSKEYQVVDPWHETISRFASNRDYVTVDEIYHELSIEPARRDIINQRRITAVLKLLGLKDTRITVAGTQIRVWANDNYNNGIEKSNLKSDDSAVYAVLPENPTAETHTQLGIEGKSVEKDSQIDTYQNHKTVEEKIEIPLSTYSSMDSSHSKTGKTAENGNFSNNFVVNVESIKSSNTTEVVQPVETPQPWKPNLNKKADYAGEIVEIVGFGTGKFQVEYPNKRLEWVKASALKEPKASEPVQEAETVQGDLFAEPSPDLTKTPEFIELSRYWSLSKNKIVRITKITEDTVANFKSPVVLVTPENEPPTNVSFDDLVPFDKSPVANIKVNDIVSVVTGIHKKEKVIEKGKGN